MTENIKLLFVYNADNDVVNASVGYLHKVFKPSTYPCELCEITHSNLGERKAWSKIKKSSNFDMEFIYKKEFTSRFTSDVLLPAVFKVKGEVVEVLLNKKEIAEAEDAEGLMQSLTLKLQTI